jgi:hypothetical protein
MVRRGKLSWTEDESQGLLPTLGCAGYGFVPKASVGLAYKEIE